ncbi:hypothetical protein C0J52_03844 [Blattella germanica]|nr:hypothetical protein C0J52_03844 [Blattella germanica]
MSPPVTSTRSSPKTVVTRTTKTAIIFSILVRDGSTLHYCPKPNRTVIIMLRMLCLLLVLTDPSMHHKDNSSLEISIRQGKLRGFRLTSRKGREFFAFQRIPYVKSPVGNLRFQSPEPGVKWEGTLDATKETPRCIQRNIYMGETEITGQEDCLYINVYTPSIKQNKLRDVMVFIHGGGWIAFTSLDAQPQYLMDRDVVLEWGVHPVIPFKPVVETGEDAFLPATPLELAKKVTNPVPWMIGINQAEGAIIAAGMYAGNMISDLDDNFEAVLPITMNPTPKPFKGVRWPQVSNSNNLKYVQIDINGLHVKQGLLKERVEFWDSLLNE